MFLHGWIWNAPIPVERLPGVLRLRCLQSAPGCTLVRNVVFLCRSFHSNSQPGLPGGLQSLADPLSRPLLPPNPLSHKKCQMNVVTGSAPDTSRRASVCRGSTDWRSANGRKKTVVFFVFLFFFVLLKDIWEGKKKSFVNDLLNLDKDTLDSH